MAQKIKFEFNDKLSHQLKAIDSTVNLFKGLSINAKGLYTGNRFFADDYSSNPKITLGTRILDNLKQIQLNNDIFPDNSLCNGDFAIVFAYSPNIEEIKNILKLSMKEYIV